MTRTFPNVMVRPHSVRTPARVLMLTAAATIEDRVDGLAAQPLPAGGLDIQISFQPHHEHL
jgi:hypothetical protein